MTIRKNFLYSMICVGLLATGCRKGFLDLNDNPNQVKEPTLPAFLSTATHKSGINNYNVGGITNVYVQYTANPSAAAASDTYQEIDVNGTWDALNFAMADIYDMKQLAIAQGSSEYLGVANVLLSYNLTLATDLWGDVPFSQAYNQSSLTPAYDKQEDVYKVASDMLDSAINQLAITTSTIKLLAANDLIHGGNRTKWLQTAWALKARLLNKLSKTANYKPADVLAALDKAYKSNADDAAMKGFQLRNPWAQVSRNNANLTLGGWLSEQFIDHLNGTTYGILDPRIRKITDTALGNKYIGTENGAGNKGPGNNTVKDECYISTNSPWSSDTSAIPIVTFAELKFIEAEAALPTDAARAYTAFLAGINANMDKLLVPAGTERTAYLTAASVGAAGLTKELIFKEKYVVTYLNPEAWNDARRNDYNYKNFTLPKNAVLTQYIRRLAYPTNERSRNGANVPGTPALTDRLFWDK